MKTRLSGKSQHLNSRINKLAITLIACLLLAGFGNVSSVFAESWTPVPLVTAATKNAGNMGGEGAQWPIYMTVSESDPNFMLYGTDVGGMFRSTNGGASWEPSGNGFDSGGATGMQIDPFNANRAIAIGAYSMPLSWNGLYLTTNKGASWTRTRGENIAGYRDTRDQIAYDRSSYDAAAGYTKVVYWSRVRHDSYNWGTPTIDPNIYKSTDGGATWNVLASSADPAGGDIAVHPTNGWVYAASDNGFYRSKNGGVSFDRLRTSAAVDIEVIPSQPNTVWITQDDGIYKSTDSGDSFTKVSGSTWPAAYPKYLAVSPVNPSNMMISEETDDWTVNRHYRSTDGGVTWSLSQNIDSSNSFIPLNLRSSHFVWSPTNGNTVWGFGGDVILKSTDAGANWQWANNGNNGIMTGGLMNWSTQDGNVMYMSAQDYNGGLTTDAGNTWTYVDPNSNGWVYGGYALNNQIMYGGYGHGSYSLYVTRNGATSGWTNTGLPLYGMQISYSDPADSNVLFAWEYRSGDGGQTWKPLAGARGVFTSNPTGQRELYGSYGGDVVTSFDKGLTWSTVVSLPSGEGVRDIAYDQKRNRLFIASTAEKLYRFESGVLTDITSHIPADQMGNRWIWSVAVDPGNPNIVYKAGAANIYQSDVSAARSIDGGDTWQSLNLSPRFNNSAFGKSGGIGASVVRVNPVTHEAFFGSVCYGLWKIGAPAGVSVPAQGPAAPAVQGQSVLYANDFQSNSAVDWTFASGSAGSGQLQFYDFSGNRMKAIYDGQSFSGDYRFSADVTAHGAAYANVSQLAFNYQNDSNFYYLSVGGGDNNTVELHKVVSGSDSTLAVYSSSWPVTDKRITYDIQVKQGNSITVTGIRDNVSTLLFDHVSDSSLQSGKIGFMGMWNAFEADNVLVTSAGSSNATGELNRFGWTATATDSYYQRPASNALDGDNNTSWTSGVSQASGQNFIVDMKSVQNFDRIELDLGTANNDYMRGYNLYASNDGANWGSPIASGVGVDPVTTISFASQSARYFKITLTGANGYWWSITELKVFKTVALNRTGWSAAATNSYYLRPESNALDGDSSTSWTSGVSQASGQTFVIDMKAAQTIRKLVLDLGTANNDYMRGYEVYVSSNGTNWGSPVASGVGLNPLTTISFSPQTARYIKFQLTAANGYWWSITELNVY
ncbi:discoidin domain-containing protein [Paenibacillus sp. JDR-2]|uniref:discoidin domain-containing protein n=1 Tax=Paenibacillus sp. (strain JDR-2) TaxID=324057 RepID=UPI0001666D6C|nr:discoidin domain-containing protein [Paenibacillus sp. JDR-2]ACT01224.1 coagulation factor 5/8 type domain protein [Paenibacillus sp. JDR-2]